MTDTDFKPSPTILMPRTPRDLGPIEGGQLPAAEAQRVLEAIEAQLQRFNDAAIAKKTRLAYVSDLKDFLWWCQRLDLEPLPAEASTVMAYITACGAKREYLHRRHGRLALVSRQLSYASIKRRLASILFLHRETGHDASPFLASQPEMRRLLRGIQRTLGTRPRRKKGLSLQQIQRMVDWLRRRPSRRGYPEARQEAINRRDVALFLVACATGRRRSELAALEIGDLTFDEHGVAILIERSKGDQAARGQELYMAAIDSKYCPVIALREHLGSRQRGPVFCRLDNAAKRSQYTGETKAMKPPSIASVFKAAAEAIGLDPKTIGAHTTRRAMATLAVKAGAYIGDVRKTGGWTSEAGMSPYLEEGKLKTTSVTSKVLG